MRTCTETAHMTGLETRCLNEKYNTHSSCAKSELKQTSTDLDNDKCTTALNVCAWSSDTCMIVSHKHSCHIRTHRRLTSGLHPQQKSLSRLPRIPEFTVLLVRLLHRKREYLDPVSISPKTSIIQTG